MITIANDRIDLWRVRCINYIIIIILLRLEKDRIDYTLYHRVMGNIIFQCSIAPTPRYDLGEKNVYSAFHILQTKSANNNVNQCDIRWLWPTGRAHRVDFLFRLTRKRVFRGNRLRLRCKTRNFNVPLSCDGKPDKTIADCCNDII